MPKASENFNVDSKSLRQLFANMEKGLVVEAYMESLSISKLMPLIFKGVDIEAPLDHYLETVCLLLFHYYSNPENVLQLYELQFKDLSDYMRSWLTSRGDFCQIPPKYSEFLPKMNEVAEFIFVKDTSVASVFCTTTETTLESEDLFLVEFKGSKYNIVKEIRSERNFIPYVQHVLFQIIQLYKSHQLTRLQAERGAEFIVDCLQLIDSIKSINLDEEEQHLVFTEAFNKRNKDESQSLTNIQLSLIHI